MSKKLAIAMFGQKRLSREGGVEIVVKELCTRMAQNGCDVTCYNRAGHHVSGAEYDDVGKTEYEGIRQKSVPTIERRGLAAVSSSAFAALYSAFGKYDVVHIHAEGPAFFAWLPKMFGKRVVVTVHGIDAGHSFLKNNSRTPNLNLIQSNRKLPTGSSISLGIRVLLYWMSPNGKQALLQYRFRNVKNLKIYLCQIYRDSLTTINPRYKMTILKSISQRRN